MLAYDILTTFKYGRNSRVCTLVFYHPVYCERLAHSYEEQHSDSTWTEQFFTRKRAMHISRWTTELGMLFSFTNAFWWPVLFFNGRTSISIQGILSCFIWRDIELGCHEWIALRRLITKSRNSEIVFFKKPYKWTENLRTGSRKDYSMDHYITETLQPTGHFQMADRSLTQSPLCVAQRWSVLVFPLQKFQCWKFRNFVLPNKALVCLLTCLHLTAPTLSHQ